MNKIYKVIYCKATQTMVAVSEFAKGHGKKGGVRGSLAVSTRLKLLSAAVILALSGQTMADTKFVPFESYSGSTAGYSAVSLGFNTHAGAYAIAAGKNTTAGNFSTATGADTIASGDFATAMGYSSKATGAKAFAVGSEATASADYAVAIGSGTASEAHAVALGFGTNSTGVASTAMGSSTTASGENATAMGRKSEATGRFSTAMGANTKAEGDYSTAMGNHTEASSDFATAMGSYSKAEGYLSTAMGASTTASGGFSTAMGANTEASGESSTAMGASTTASGDYSTAMGRLTEATGITSTAMGSRSLAAGAGSLATGGCSVEMVARKIGSSGSKKATCDDGDGIEGGKAYTLGSMALGNETIAGVEDGDQEAVAMGYRSQAVANKTLAIGFDAVAEIDNGLALGSDAKTTADKGAFGYDISTDANSTDTSSTWNSTRAALAIGNADEDVTRQITGLAAGTEDTDAVNVAQLKKVAAGVAPKTYFHVNENDPTQGVGDAATNLGAIRDKAGAVGGYGVTAGVGAQATGYRGVAIGLKTKATNDQSIAIGSAGAESAGGGTIASGHQSIAIGGDTEALGHSSIVLGGDDLDQVASTSGALWNDYSLDNNAFNDTQAAKDYKSLTGEDLVDNTDVTTRYHKTTGQGQGSIVIGVQSKADGDLATVVGVKSEASEFGSTALGLAAKATKKHAVALGAGSTTETDATQVNEATVGGITYGGFAGYENVEAGDQVSVGSNGHERQIKHVAPGAITGDSTDAINGSQLYAVAAQAAQQTAKPITFKADENSGTGVDNGSDQQLGSKFEILSGDAGDGFIGINLKTKVEDGKVTIGMTKRPKFNLIELGDASNNTTLTSTEEGLDVGGDKITNVAAGTNDTDAVNLGQLKANNDNLYGAIGEVSKDSKAGIAGAYAAAALGQPHDPGASTIGAAIGTFRDEAALSIGVSTISDNGRWILKGLIGHDTQNNTGAAASVNYQW